MTFRFTSHILATSLIALLCVPAVAEPQTPAWHEGISEDSQQAARALMQEGLELHGQLQWADAVDKYELALKHWPTHPEIHFSMGRALDKLSKPLQAYESLTRALQWGQDGLPSHEEYELARAIQARLLRDELGEIEVRCDVPGAAVSLNGELWFAGPDTRRRVVLAGVYNIEVSRRGYHTVTQSTSLLAGKQAIIQLEMEADRGILFKTRWRAWVPWAVIGAGVALSAAGGGLLWLSRRDFTSYDALLNAECFDTAGGCTLSDQKKHDGLRIRAEWEQGISSGLFGAAGAALFAGTVMMIVNRPEPYRDEYRDPNRWQITPLASTDGVGASVSWLF